ncbi:MAG: hypothetical protein ACP5JJ_02050 [Anaerolineae bacterium]
MFASFSAGDSLRVYRLQRKGVSLDLRTHLTQTYTPLWAAWLAFVTQQAMGHPTYVLYDLHDGEGFIQMRYRPHQAAADVTFLAPALDGDGGSAAAWARLLDGAGVEAAGRGIQRVFASLPESGSEVDVFHQAGFILYAAEDVYRLEQIPDNARPGLVSGLRDQRPEDWPAIQKLCVTVTPQRVRQAEGGIVLTAAEDRQCRRYVLRRADSEEIIAALNICVGTKAHWLRLLVHPDFGQEAEPLIRWALRALGNQQLQPVYCNVRQYESGVRPALASAGFEPMVTRALMVKHTVAWSKSSVQELAAALKSAEPVPPTYRINGEADLGVRKGRLATTRDT